VNAFARFCLLPLAFCLFVVLATMNSAGYRYAASDQAFYIPAVLRQLDPSLFPRDAGLIDAQAGLTLVDEIAAAVVHWTGLSLQHLFFALYLLSLLLMFGAAVAIGSRLYRTTWTTIALCAALTLRHAIAKTGANTLEGYFHPRQLAFALGLCAVAGLLARRDRLAVVLLLAGAVLHPTTALWFLAWLVVAAWFSRPAWRRALLACAAAGVIGGVMAVTAGPLGADLVRMDGEWLAAIGEKDLYPFEWPFDAWLTNLVTVPIVFYGWRARRRAGVVVPGETALTVGALALFALFLCWLPFNHARVALAVQLQLSRVFWMLDIFATIYLVWWLAEGASVPAVTRRRAAAVAGVLLALSAGRALYTTFVQFPDRHIFAIDVQHADGRNAMAFARTTDPASGWLADPIHAAQYGASLRATGNRDVLLEALKDPAIAMYDRPTAMRLADRQRALQSLQWDTPDGARGLARRFGLDYLVIDRELSLPLVHQTGSLYVYRLR
jgi:hypothetical protein